MEKTSVYVTFFIGDYFFKHVPLAPGQMTESLLSIVYFLQLYGLVVNHVTNCLMYGIERNMKQCKFANKVEAQLEPPDSTEHGLCE
jgi:hypothetical protein